MFKAASKSYKKKVMTQRKEDLFPQLREELAKKRAILQEGLEWPDADTRLSDAYKTAMADLVKDKIGVVLMNRVTIFERCLQRSRWCIGSRGARHRQFGIIGLVST